MRIMDWSSDVCSSDLCSWVAACRNATSRPTSAAAPTGGPDRIRVSHRACLVSSITSPIASSSGAVGQHQAVHQLGPAVDQHEQKQLERQRDSRSEEHTSELQSLKRISYAVFCLKKKKTIRQTK